MNVGQLRDLLAEFPDDLVVWHDGGGDPYCAGEVHEIAVVRCPPGRVLLGHADDTPSVWLELR